MGLLDGKRALITGARKGIGRGIALTLASEGASVGVNDLIDDEVTARTLELIEGHGVKASMHQGDVSTVDGIHEVVDGFVDTQDGIDILVNNAIFPDQARPLFETDETYWDRMMDLSLKGVLLRGATGGQTHGRPGHGGAHCLSFECACLCGLEGLDCLRCGEGGAATHGEGSGRRPVGHRCHRQLHRTRSDLLEAARRR